MHLVSAELTNAKQACRHACMLIYMSSVTYCLYRYFYWQHSWLSIVWTIMWHHGMALGILLFWYVLTT